MLTTLAGWALMNPSHQAPAWTGIISGVSFSPYRAGQDPRSGENPTAAQIEQDLQLIRGKVRSVRTYTSLDGMEVVPQLAEENGVKVTAGAWLDQRTGRNALEVASLIHNARSYPSIERLIVGNEAILRADLTVAQVIDYLRQVRAETELPVSTAEPWHVWLRHPELARAVDFIAVHLLPYWEGIPAEHALAFVLERYRELRRAFPDKHILIAEVGWPSAGDRIEHSNDPMFAVPSRVSQAQFVRSFLNVAEREGMDYFLMEAFDQPWKRAIEGRAGGHWGLYDVQRGEKFPMRGELIENPLWPAQATLALALTLLPGFWFLSRQRHIRTPGQLLLVGLVGMGASVLSWTLFVPALSDLSLGGLLSWGLVLGAQLLLFLVLLVNGFELAEMLWARRLRRQFRPTGPLYPIPER